MMYTHYEFKISIVRLKFVTKQQKNYRSIRYSQDLKMSFSIESL